MTDFLFNMACQEDFYAGENLEAILEAIGENIWHKDVQFNAEVDDLIRESEAELPYGYKCGYKCEKCEKMSSQNKVSLDIKI